MPAKNYLRHFVVSLQKCCCNNKFKKFYMIFMLLVTCSLLHYSNAETATTTKATTTNVTNYLTSLVKKIHQPHECGSVDVRNDCTSFQQLNNCTVVKGFLMIVLILRERLSGKSSEKCEISSLKFPLLREVTDFVLFYHVKGLTSIREMFPNLTVIRGRRLLHNYALSVSQMPVLEALEFSSLVAIQRGHVFIASCPKLCQLERINWERLTLTHGQNYIFPIAPEKCDVKSVCSGCKQKSCWSNRVCQKFENDNVLHYMRDTIPCHEECLGGCLNSTNADCAVCRHLTDHGLCVKECPSDKYVHEHSQRCYTRDECVTEMNYFIHENTCVRDCPNDYKPHDNYTCVKCGNDDSCENICQAEHPSPNIIIIYSLSDADYLAGCKIINATLIITIKDKINEEDLVRSLSSIREIRGYLKIISSPYLTSLNFFVNLQKIVGMSLESGQYSLVIYNNKRIQELWKPHTNLELERGSMYIHQNYKLCNHLIQEFSNKVIHDHKMDSIQTSDQETLCGPIKLVISIQVISHRDLLVSWKKALTSDEVEVLTRPVLETETFNEESELDTPVCERIKWRRELVFKSDFNDNDTDFSYIVTGLQQNTRYACMVKTFGADFKKNTRSNLIFITTKTDIPPPPVIKVVKKTNSTLTIALNQHKNNSDYKIGHYLLEVFEEPDDVNYLDKRNYCVEPTYMSKSVHSEPYTTSANDVDYDDCCDRLKEDMEDERFMTNMRDKFSCSLDRKKRCTSVDETKANIEHRVLNLLLPSSDTTYTIKGLISFRLYIIRVKACNEIGCSSFGTRSERTNFTTAGDLVGDLEGCRTPDNSEYRIYFSEPKHPNGVTVSYMVHFREYVPNAEELLSDVRCITRLEHQKAKNNFIDRINSTFNQFAVRAHSLAGDAFSHWYKITTCDPAHTLPTKIAGPNQSTPMPHGSRLNIFLVFFLLGATGTVLWICYKRRYWRRIPELRQYLPYNRTQVVRALVERDESTLPEDRQILVDNFETVRFQNRPFPNDDDDDTNCSSLSD